MQLFEVTTPRLAQEFLEANVVVNRHHAHYIRPLDKDVEAVFDPKKNKTFRFGTATRWVLKDDNGTLIGRIAAFTNKKYRTKGDEGPVGGIGFFDCINNQKAADMLFDVARHWLLQQGMEAMDGPINFGERDRWWGLVVEGFQEPLYCMNYNAPYYKELFENYGFHVFFNQVCFGMHPKQPLAQKIWDRHAQYANDPAFKARYIDKNQLEKFAGDFATVYNAAWAGHGGMKQLKKEQVVHLFKQMKPVMDEKIVWFVYHNDAPIAIFINLPDLNQWFKYLDGKFGLLDKLKFLWIKRTKPCKKFVGIVFGVVPEWQGKGIDSYMIAEAAKVVQRTEIPYNEYEMQWIGDFNPKMINVAENFSDTYRSRMLSTYRYLFDRTKEFKRHPIL
jgi:GNAT superfamily N-acetyltransferase